MEIYTSQDQNSEKEKLANIELAKFHIAQDMDLQKTTYIEQRKRVTLVGVGILILIAMIITFIVWCLIIGKEAFIIDLLKYFMYPISAGGGFWAGRASRNSNLDND